MQSNTYENTIKRAKKFLPHSLATLGGVVRTRREQVMEFERRNTVGPLDHDAAEQMGRTRAADQALTTARRQRAEEPP